MLFTCLLTTAVTFIIIHMTFQNSAFYSDHLSNLIIYVISLSFIYQLSKRYFYGKKINPMNKAVLITGCDSGFGNETAKRLDSRGFHVFASCLFPEGNGAGELKKICSDRLKVLPLDVTSDESVANALKFVKENIGSDVLWAVINNAGITKGSSTDFSTVTHFKDTIDVNALGPVRVSKAFLPLLKKSKGRVVNVTSLAGRVSAPIGMCPYTMSKYAAVAFSQCLSLEMGVWGVRVISIEPEVFRSAMTEPKDVISRLKAEMREIDKNIISSYGEEYIEKFEKCVTTCLNKASHNTDIVVDAMESAVTKEHPNHVYKPRWSWFTQVFFGLAENVPFSFYEMIPILLSKWLKPSALIDAKTQ